MDIYKVVERTFGLYPTQVAYTVDLPVVFSAVKEFVTPNDQQAVQRMMYFGADGVVTDNLTAVKQAKQQNNQRHYADKLAYYVIGIG